MGKPGVFDYVVLAVIIAATLFEWLWYWPRCVQAIRAHVPGARARSYRNLIVAEWIVTLYVLGLWAAKGRPWSALWLGPVSHLRLGLGLLFAAVIISLHFLQTRKILTQPKVIAKVREKIAYLEPLIPDTSGERRAFWLVSITAGICEEILFRGFVMRFIAAWTGLILAVILSSVLFGFGHIYLGLGHVPRTAVIGLALAIIVLASNSLWPAIIIHAAIDLNSGNLGFWVKRASVAPSVATPSFTN